MAKTRRRHSYRKSKRWNPKRRSARRGRRNPRWARPGENNIETVRITRGGSRRNCGRNPGRRPDIVRHLRDGSRVEVSRDGQVEVYDRDGLFSRYEVGGGRLAHFIKSVQHAGKRADKYSFQGESLKDEGSYDLRMNPRRGRGHRTRRNPMSMANYRKWEKMRSTGRLTEKKIRWWYAAVRHGSKKGRVRSNPAQFPMPFMSALSNPRISKSEARAMKRVLARHGKGCSTRSRRSRRSRRGRRR